MLGWVGKGGQGKSRRTPGWLRKWSPGTFFCWACLLPQTGKARALENVTVRKGFLEELAPRVNPTVLLGGDVQGCPEEGCGGRTLAGVTRGYEALRLSD